MLMNMETTWKKLWCRAGLLLFLMTLIPLVATALSLSTEEVEWLSAHKDTTLRYIIPPKYYPISFVDQGRPNGVVLEYIKVLEKELGLKTQLVDVPWSKGLKMTQHKEIDLLPCVSFTPERAEYLKFTDNPYLTLPIVLISRKDITHVRQLDDIKGYRVAVDPSLVAYSKLKNDYKHLNIEFVFRETTPEVIRAVHLGDADFSFASAAVAGYLISQNGWSNLMIAAETDWPDTKLRMAVRNDWPILAGMIDRVIQSMPRRTKETVFNKWVPVRFEHGLQEDFIVAVILPIVGVSILIISVLTTLFIWTLLRRNQAVTNQVKLSLETQQALLDSVINSIPDLIFVKDLQGVYLACNKAFAKFVGQKREKIIGIDDYGLFNKEIAEEFRDQDRMMLSGNSFREDGWVTYPDGSRVLLDTLKTPFIESNGQINGLVGISHDITERYQTTIKLKDNEERFRSLVNNIPGVVFRCLLDQKSTVVYVSDEIETLSGYPASDFQGADAKRTLSDLVFADDRQAVAESRADAIEERRPFLNEYRIIDREGKVHWVVAKGQAIFDEQGEALYLDGTIFDDSERKSFEEELRKISRAVEQNPASIVITNRKGEIEYVNPKFCQVTGYSVEEAMGQNPRILKSGTMPPEIYQDLWRTISAGSDWKGELLNKTKSGELYWESISISPVVSANGKITHYIAIKENISDRKKMEAELTQKGLLMDALIDSPKDIVIFSLDTSYRYTAFNRAHFEEMKRIFGTEIQLGMNLLEAITMPDMVSVLESAFERVLGGDVFSEVRLLPELGLYFEFNWGGVQNEEKEIIGISAFVRDITDRKKLDKELKNRVNEQNETQTAMLNMMEDLEVEKQNAEAATRAKSDFLANMSHEIRTPMNAVMGMTHLALQTELTSKQRDYLNKVHGSAQSLLGIINDILDFSKIEAGKLDMEVADFNLDEVLENVSNLIANKAQAKELEFLVQSPVDLPKFLIGDPLRLGQILINLANNSVKFTEQGEVVISVLETGKKANKVTLQFTVRDTGIGLSQEQIGKLFQSFSQADTSTTRKFGGTGLGLTISKRLVEMMNGEIWVESEPGKGSSFIFTAEFECQTIRRETNLALAHELKGLHVLVVDDNETSRQIFREILESFDFNVALAFTGGKAIDALTSTTKSFDLIIMDWKMPGMNGIETSRQIRNHLKLPLTPKIIMCTSYGREEVMQQAQGIGLDGFLVKPVNPSVLLDTILEVFGKAATDNSRKLTQTLSDTEGFDQIRGARVLLVEDNEINQQVAQELLEREGLIVDIAENGKEGIKQVYAAAYDVVLMDIQMPVMGGYEATRQIRKDPKFNNLHILAMTANAMVGDREKALAVGMNDHIAKPIDPGQLFSTLLKWIKPGDRKLPEGFIQAKRTKEKENEPADEMPAQLPGLDVTAGLSRMGGNAKRYRNLLQKFPKNQGSVLEEIKTALNSNDIELAVRLAHTIKGVSGNIGAMELHTAARDLESGIKAEGKDVAAVLLESAQTRLDQVLNSVATLQVANEVEVDSAAEMDPVIIKPLLEELTRLLEDDDTEAITVVEKLQACLKGPEAALALSKVEKRIGDYDFEEALEELAGLVKILFG